jgi:hypothetical protein
LLYGRLHRAFAPIKRYLPKWIWSPIRRLATAVLTPIFFSYDSGHLRSSFAAKAVTKTGKPIPWYTYPCIDFLAARNFSGRIVLEFGAGQSTLWWAARAKRVVALEESAEWLAKLRPLVPVNASLHQISTKSRQACVDHVRSTLREEPHDRYDVIVIDGLYRQEMVPIAQAMLSDDGIIICDNSEGYGFRDAFIGSNLSRVDFYGYTPGVVWPQATSIFFRPGGSFAFSPDHEIATSLGL